VTIFDRVVGVVASLAWWLVARAHERERERRRAQDMEALERAKPRHVGIAPGNDTCFVCGQTDVAADAACPGPPADPRRLRRVK